MTDKLPEGTEGLTVCDMTYYGERRLYVGTSAIDMACEPHDWRDWPADPKWRRCEVCGLTEEKHYE